MKNIKYTIIAICCIFTLQACSSDDDSSSQESSTTSETKTVTKAVLTIVNSDKQVKPNYIVMMFDKEFVPINSSPSDAIKTVTSDAKGIANFNLENSASKVTYYFEAFLKKQDGTYTLESKYRTKLDINKGENVKTEIIVN